MSPCSATIRRRCGRPHGRRRGGVGVNEPAPVVGVIMGSDSDWTVMSAAAEVLAEFGVGYEARVVSAHRTPRDMLDYAATAADRGLRVIVAGGDGLGGRRAQRRAARRPHPRCR